MTLKEYIKTIIAEFIEAEGQEVTGTKEITFDVGLRPDGTVMQESANRIRFTLLVKRA